MAETDTNYYLLLDLPLDPPVKDKARLEAAIEKKLSEWNLRVTHPNGLLYKSLASKVPEIKKGLLTDEASRDAIIEEALKIVRARVGELLEAIAKAGSVTEAQVKEICKKNPQLSEKTIRKMIKVPIVEKAGPVFKVPPKPADPPIPPTSNMDMYKFEKDLAVLHINNIYDFLGCSRTSTPEAICRLADEELEKTHKAPIKTAEVSARQELAGLITSYFKKPKAKEAYDLALKLVIQKKLIETFAIRCISKSIEWKAYQDSIADCRAIGMSQEEAEYFVYDYYCEKKHCPPPQAPNDGKPLPTVHYCKACLAPNPEGAVACNNCGTPFKVTCPKCGQVVDLNASYCAKCSFPIGDMPLATSLLKESQLLAATGNLAKAAQVIDQALVYWPNNSDCLKVKADIEQRRKKALDEAAERERKAQLEIAKAHLDNITIVGTVKATVREGNVVELIWPQASIRNPALKTDLSKITYFLRRKANAIPSAPQDGTPLTETKSQSYEDTSCEPGVIYGYSVFPGYAGIPCKGGIALPKVMTVADVSGLKATSDDRAVRLQWRNPQNSVNIKCIRKIGGEPKNISDGEEVHVEKDAQGLVDTGLKNRQVYGYRVFALFNGINGELVASRGVTCHASPAERPPILDELLYEINDGNVKLSWKPISGYIVRIFYSRTPLASAETFVSETDPIFAKCALVQDIDQQQGEGNWKIPDSGLYYLTPVTCKDGMVLVGKAVAVIPCVTNIKAIRYGGKIELTWEWPHDSDKVKLVWRNDRPPESPFDTTVANKIVMQTEYKRDMAYIVKNVKDETYFFAIYTLFIVEGKEVYSAPVYYVSIGEANRRTLTYSFKKKKKYAIFGENTVTLDIKVSSGSIPEMVLLKQFGRLPLSRQDGVVCLRIHATNDSTATIQLPKDVAEAGAFLKLFFANAELDQVFRVNHPGFNEMRM